MLSHFVFGVTILTIVPSITWARSNEFLSSICGRFAAELPVSPQIRVLDRGIKPRLFSNAWRVNRRSMSN